MCVLRQNQKPRKIPRFQFVWYSRQNHDSRVFSSLSLSFSHELPESDNGCLAFLEMWGLKIFVNVSGENQQGVSYRLKTKNKGAPEKGCTSSSVLTLKKRRHDSMDMQYLGRYRYWLHRRRRKIILLQSAAKRLSKHHTQERRGCMTGSTQKESWYEEHVVVNWILVD